MELFELKSPFLNPTAYPIDKGSYVFSFLFPQNRSVQIGKLGRFQFPAGIYHYCGSAHGSGGLRARLRRHLNPQAPLRWHIDYLKEWMTPTAIHYAISLEPLECVWAQRLTLMPTASIPVPHFGSSDCKSYCPAHLIQLPQPEQNLAGILTSY
jgi:Uri superfamily endonuclease